MYCEQRGGGAALASLRICADSIEPSLLADAIRIENSCTVPILMYNICRTEESDQPTAATITFELVNSN